ncbi:MAG: hypothetical protein QOD06_217 [Candidatus Binatota bacterium]|nr:hypothetical protein [Candidatus Binatota bacterium]
MRSPFAELLSELTAVLRAQQVRWFLFGAQAAIVHGATRLTNDVYVTVELGGRHHSLLVSALEDAGFESRVRHLDEVVSRTRVLPFRHRPSGIDLDVILAGPGPEAQFLDRAVRRTVEGVRTMVASAEDVVVMKVLAGRAKDVDDVTEIVASQPKLRLPYIRRTLTAFETGLDRSDLISAFERIVVIARPRSAHRGARPSAARKPQRRRR